MGRYSKLYSNYVLKKRHQVVEGGTIFERDWGTLGERHVIESGKKRVYGDSNFLFTDNNRPGNRYRNSSGEWSEAITQDTLDQKIDQTVNDTSILDTSNDIRDYAYYGSAVELVRVSIENIVKWFPGRFWSGETHIMSFNEEGQPIWINNIITDGHHNYAIQYTDLETDDCVIYQLANPFTIDFHTTNANLGKYDNSLRNMPLSYKQYRLNNGEIKTWNVWARPYNDCVEDYTIKYDITFTYVGENSEAKSGHIYGFAVAGNIVWGTNVKNMVVQPTDSIIDNYFKNLDGFEAKLLSRTHDPIYSVNLITPEPMGDNIPDYNYVEKWYSWPHDGYCIDVDSIFFSSYVDSLYNLATIMDDVWCDNIWRSMTHEAITSFDWTHTRQYEEGQEEESILGGTRMEGILRIWGRCYDDIKRYIDSISLKNCITYNNEQQNLANAELSDKASLLGWEVFSTKPNHDTNLYLDQEFFDEYVTKLDQSERWDCSNSGNEDCEAYVSYEKWYDTRNLEQVSQNMVDNDFMKRLTLSTGEIFRSKGTRHAIEMVFGMFGIGNHDENNPDFTIKEQYYKVKPKKRDDDFYYYESQDYLTIENPDEYTALDDYESLDDYLAEHPADANSPNNILINGVYYQLRYMKVGEFCEYITAAKILRLNYEDDEFSGSPIKDVFLDNEHYIVPYFRTDRIYDGNVNFETRGGWGKMLVSGNSPDDAKTQEYDYLETIPYAEVVQTVSSLLSVNPYYVGFKRMYYVMNLSDLSEYVETIPNNISHWFKLAVPSAPNSFENWKNIPNDGVVDPNYDIFAGITDDDIKLANYCDGLKFDNLGNNPHCGNGGYDLGNEYLEHLKMPFKYLIDNYGFNSDADAVAASQFKFEVTPVPEEKIKIVKESEIVDEYILPSKVLTIVNNINNPNYKQYLHDIILKYVLQVIPSTTILILEDSDYIDDEQYYYLSKQDVPEEIRLGDFETSTESDISLEDRMGVFTLIVVPSSKTVTLEYTSDGIRSFVTECDEQHCLVKIDGSYVRDLPDGYKVLQYYFEGINAEETKIHIQ